MFDFKILIFKFTSTFVNKYLLKRIMPACAGKTPRVFYWRTDRRINYQTYDFLPSKCHFIIFIPKLKFIHK